jgi:FkbM family methyltransferase
LRWFAVIVSFTPAVETWMSGLSELKLKILRAIGRHLHVRGRDRLIRALEGPDRMRDYPFVEAFHGLRYPGNLKRFIDWSVFFYGGYSGFELAALGDIIGEVRKHRDGPLVAWDVGANVGHHALMLHGATDRTFAFEPLPTHAALIREKLEFNGIDTSGVFEVALGDKEGEMTIFHPDPDSAANLCTASLHEDFNTENNTLKSVIKVEVGDDFRATHDLPAPDIFKLDVEGFEHKVLTGMSKTIFEASPIVLMETTPHTWESYESVDGLKAMFPPAMFLMLTATANPNGYRLQPLDPGTSHEVLIIPDTHPEIQKKYAPALSGRVTRKDLFG